MTSQSEHSSHHRPVHFSTPLRSPMLAGPAMCQPETYSKKEFDQALELARQALQLVGQFQTPPTPDVFEVWYRFVEGEDPALNEQIGFCINELKTVTRNKMQELHQQFFASAHSHAQDVSVSEALTDELGGLKTVIDQSIQASDEFGQSVNQVSVELSTDADPNRIQACVDSLLDSKDKMASQLQSANDRLKDSQQHVDALRASLLESQKSMVTDPLTGVGNRRHFDALMQQCLSERSSNNLVWVLVLVDLDHFKEVNDTFGHAAGDDVLKFAASEMQRLAQNASIARYGGDEFAIFVKCHKEDHGQSLADSICQFFTKNKLTRKRTGETLGQVTVSVGAAHLRQDDDQESWFDRADKLLYSAKQCGRGRAMVEGRK